MWTPAVVDTWGTYNLISHCDLLGDFQLHVKSNQKITLVQGRIKAKPNCPGQVNLLLGEWTWTYGGQVKK